MTTVCKQPILTKKLSDELADSIGKLLLEELQKESVKKKVDRAIADFAKGNSLIEKPAELAKRLDWSVKVQLKSST